MLQVQWTTNTLANGDVLVYVANNKGIAKPAVSCSGNCAWDS